MDFKLKQKRREETELGSLEPMFGLMMAAKKAAKADPKPVFYLCHTVRIVTLVEVNAYRETYHDSLFMSSQQALAQLKDSGDCVAAGLHCCGAPACLPDASVPFTFLLAPRLR